MPELIKNYRSNDALRKSFNSLAGKTFGLDFEDWYQNGFWGDHYNPYSITENGKVIANVSVNKTDMLFDGTIRHFLQLGTVMTDKAHRNRGFIRRIMEQIDNDFSVKGSASNCLESDMCRGAQEQCAQRETDGIYLFANDSVLDFYPRFGFQRAKEYAYSRDIQNTGEWRLTQIIMDTPAGFRLLENAIKANVFHSRFDMLQNSGLILFYVTKYMRENVYYHGPSNTWVIAEAEGENLLLHNVFSATLTELDEVLALFGKGVRHVTLGFVPVDTQKYQITELKEEDCTLFIRGDALKIIEQERLRIPSLSHA